MSVRAWIQKARDLGASDLHVEADTPPVVRVRGVLHPIAEPVAAGAVEQDARSLMGAEAWDHMIARGSADISLAFGGIRCRVNVYRTIRGVALAVRLLTPSVNGLRECNLHPDLRRLIVPATGLAIVSGPTGSGKSTTLAALIEEINAVEAKNIISLESPIEYLFTNRHSLIRQREIPVHSPSFEQAIVDALRENPDVLVIGEMRTPEVMRLTLNAAETGHLVLATMHSSSCAEALTRICMSFPAEIQGNIRAQLADCLVGVVCQRLDYLPEYRLRVPRCEVLTGTLAAKATVRSGHLSQIANVIQSGARTGCGTSIATSAGSSRRRTGFAAIRWPKPSPRASRRHPSFPPPSRRRHRPLRSRRRRRLPRAARSRSRKSWTSRSWPTSPGRSSSARARA